MSHNLQNNLIKECRVRKFLHCLILIKELCIRKFGKLEYLKIFGILRIERRTHRDHQKFHNLDVIAALQGLW